MTSTPTDAFPIKLSKETGGAHYEIGTSKISKPHSMPFKPLWWMCRCVFLDLPLFILFMMFVFTMFIGKIHDDYLHPQLQLMVFNEDNRQYTDNTYYHRVCGADDFTATTPDELMIGDDFSANDSAEHMLTHGVSIYPNLLTNETASELRDWIARENYIRESWDVISDQNRFTWGIDMNMHPKLQTFWQELAANEKLLQGLEAVVGKDPAVIEFTAITSSYGAEDQYMHADLIAGASAIKYARSYVPSYSLFIPLQDTTYGMGATHVCPGTHLCSEADDPCAEFGAFSVSGIDGTWTMGSGALMNQQTIHRGMGFTEMGAPDRVVLIATFAPRPLYRNGMETRQIGQGGSYSLLWSQWGHTFSDYVHADKRMSEPQKTLRSLGFIKGNGWNYLTTLSMRMANQDTDMRDHQLDEFLDDEGGFWFLPMSWQQESLDGESDISAWHAFSISLLKRIQYEVGRAYFIGLATYVFLSSFATMTRVFSTQSGGQTWGVPMFLRMLCRIFVTHGFVLILAWAALTTIEDTPWAKAIRNRKLYRIPVVEVDNPSPSTIPGVTDILLVPHFASDYLASYARVVDFAHPGNRHWKHIIRDNAEPYRNLSPELRLLFCESLIVETISNRRFLKQDEERFWTEEDSLEELSNLCHREFTLALDPMLDSLAGTIASLQSETQFGKFRETTLQRKLIPEYLKSLEKRIFDVRPTDEFPSQTFLTKSKHKRTKTTLDGFINSWANFAINQSRTKTLDTPILRTAVPKDATRTEPFDGAWLKEGDRVEALFRCDEESGLWYRGTITAAIPNDGEYDISYDDGDNDEGLALECIRRLDPNPFN